MIKRLAIIALLSTGVLAPVPARAALGDCEAPGYLARFPEAASAADIICVEHFNFGFATPGGARQIRAISDAAAGWAVSPGLVAAAESGAQAAVRAMARLGDYRIDDVSLLLLDDAHSFTDPRLDFYAMTDGRDVPGSGECLVTLYTLAAGTTPEETENTVAHEIFHCLQYATLTSAQMATVGGGGNWWIEGSAEYFASFALPGTSATDRGADFDDSVGAGRALNEMAHEAAVFFYWRIGRSGPANLVPFMHAMAGSGDAGAQRAAMRGVLGDREWLDFATAYIDTTITRPDGRTVGISPNPRETRSVTGDGTQRIRLAPFAIMYGTVDYACGTWGNEVSPDDANLVLSPEGGRDWAPWPDEIEAEEGRPNTYWFAGMHTGDAAQQAAVRVERRRSCAPCAGTRAVDACLAGTWQMTGGGPIEWMKSQGIPITRAAEGPRIVTFRSDGAYGTEPLSMSLEVRDDDYVGRGNGYATVASGRWSAGDGRMNICQDAGGVSGSVTVTHRGTTGTQGINQPGVGTLTMRYSCAGSTLSTSIPMREFAPMETTYSKIGPDPLAGSAE